MFQRDVQLMSSCAACELAYVVERVKWQLQTYLQDGMGADLMYAQYGMPCILL